MTQVLPSSAPALALAWGFKLGATILVWLYASYYVGLHTNGLVLFQVVPLVWLGITIAGFVLAFRSFRSHVAALGYLKAVGHGAVVTVVTVVMAVVMQIGYHTVIHPEWPEFMTEETRRHFTAEGLPAEQVERHVAEARVAFGLRSYATQSAVAALVLGLLCSFAIPAIGRRRPEMSPPV